MDSKQSYCLGGRHILLTKNITEYENKNPKTNKNVKVRKKNAIFVDVINHKVLLSKRHEDKISRKKENVKINTVHQGQIQHGVI